MGCGMSLKLDSEDNATLGRGHKVVRPIADINSPINKNVYNGSDYSVHSSTKQSQKSVWSEGKEVKQVGDPEAENGGEEKEHRGQEEEPYHSQILFGSPSFKDYCIASNNSRDQSFSDHFNDTGSAYSTKNGGDEDSTKGDKKSEENEECKKKERRGLRFRNVMHKGMPRGKRKKNILNFGCYTSHASYDDATLNRIVRKTA